MTAKAVASIFGVLAVWAVSGCLFLLHSLAQQAAEVGTLKEALAALSVAQPAPSLAKDESRACETPPQTLKGSTAALGIRVENVQMIQGSDALSLSFDLVNTENSELAGFVSAHTTLNDGTGSGRSLQAKGSHFRMLNRVTKTITIPARRDPLVRRGAVVLAIKDRHDRELRLDLADLPVQNQ